MVPLPVDRQGMRAIVIERHGGPEVLDLRDRPEPAAPEGWVLVDLQAAALNRHDLLLRAGQYPQFGLPRIPGSDGAGIRRDTGEAVLVVPSLHWGPDEAAPGPEWEILGDRTDGTYAATVAVPSDCVVPVPAGWDWPQAAALGLAGLTAHRALFARGALRAGETVLVLGATGGVASIAIALARMAGARVLVTTSSEENLAWAVDQGASAGVLRTEDGWPDRVRALADGRGVDLVVDSVGSTWEPALQATRSGGRLVTFGATGAARTEIDVRRFFFAQQTILGTTMGSPQDMAALLALLSSDPGWRPPVDQVLDLGDAAAAHGLLAAGGHRGKVVLTP